MSSGPVWYSWLFLWRRVFSTTVRNMKVFSRVDFCNINDESLSGIMGISIRAVEKYKKYEEHQTKLDILDHKILRNMNKYTYICPTPVNSILWKSRYHKAQTPHISFSWESDRKIMRDSVDIVSVVDNSFCWNSLEIY